MVVTGRGLPGAKETEEASAEGWVTAGTPTNQSLVRSLERELDRGEAETIALALEQEHEHVLLDESDARRVADMYGLQKTGVVGILIRARSEGKIASLRADLDALRDQWGFLMDDGLVRQALRSVGESSE